MAATVLAGDVCAICEQQGDVPVQGQLLRMAVKVILSRHTVACSAPCDIAPEMLSTLWLHPPVGWAVLVHQVRQIMLLHYKDGSHVSSIGLSDPLLLLFFILPVATCTGQVQIATDFVGGFSGAGAAMRRWGCGCGAATRRRRQARRR